MAILRDIKTGERFYIRLCKFCTDYKGQRSVEVHKGIIPNAKKSATKGKLGTKSKTKAIGKRKGVPVRRKTTNNGKKRRKQKSKIYCFFAHIN